MNSEKLKTLKSLIGDKKKLAIAFSGGVDSTLLLAIAVEVLGVENVGAFYLNSVVQASLPTVSSIDLIENEFPPGLFSEQLQVSPLDLDLFVNNCDNRCYYCKKQMYNSLFTHVQSIGFTTLADGTNADDLLENRPGIKAIREIGVFTPLEIAGFTKREIRSEAKKRKLSNYDLASNSCLATRVEKFTKITEKNLNLIEQAENLLYDLGIIGTRVRVGGRYTIIEIEDKDFDKIIEGKNKQIIETEFRIFGLPKPCVLLKGR